MERVPPSPEAPVQFPEIASEIDSMTLVDQQMRKKALEDNTWDENVDAANTARMKEIIAKIGWPTISRVGKKSSSNAWLLVQHADHDVDFQSACLALMKQETPNEVSSKNIAYLEDRVRVNRNQSQMYGTQFRERDGERKPLPIEDEANVDERRKQMGLGSLKEGVEGMYQAYGAPDQS